MDGNGKSAVQFVMYICTVMLTLLVQLLLLLPHQLVSYPTTLETEDGIEYNFNKFIGKVHKERPIQTLLLVKRRKDVNCLPKDMNFEGFPMLRFDEGTTIKLKTVFNSELLALVCIFELSDCLLLSRLAEHLQRMREARIIIWLPNVGSRLKGILKSIERHAGKLNFLSVIVLHIPSSEFDSIIAYRLQPFPNTTLIRISDIVISPFFPKTWMNYFGKTAVILPDLLPPRSMLTKDPRTGEPKLSGSADNFIMEFGRKYNINLRLFRPLKELSLLESNDLSNLTLSSQVDLPVRAAVYLWKSLSPTVEFTSVDEIIKVLIVVPCAQEMCIGDVYKGFRTYSTIVLAAYIMFSVLETLTIATVYRIFRRRFNFAYSSVFINLETFRGVLGLPISLNRYKTSCSLKQIVILMSVFSLIFTCFFNANLSTMLTKHPLYKKIESFDDLEASGLPVAIDVTLRNSLESYVIKGHFKGEIPNTQFLTLGQRMEMLLSLNSSYAHQIFSNIWKILDKYQKSYNRYILCEASKLVIVDGLPTSRVLRENSVYRLALIEFTHRTQSSGLDIHWNLEAGKKLITSIHSNVDKNHPRIKKAYMVLGNEDFVWLWKIFGLCYAVAGIVFAGEFIVVYLLNDRAT